MADRRVTRPKETVQVNATDIEWIKTQLSSIGLKITELDGNFKKSHFVVGDEEVL